MARRGFHLTREHATDPLEILFVREAMRTRLAAFPAEATREDLRRILLRQPVERGQHLYPVVNAARRVKGVITRRQLREIIESEGSNTSLGEVLQQPVVAHPDKPLRMVVMRIAETVFTQLPVVQRGDEKLVGMISLRDLLTARARNLTEERHRERVLELRLPFARMNSVS